MSSSAMRSTDLQQVGCVSFQCDPNNENIDGLVLDQPVYLNEEEYINSLPKMFIYNYENRQNKKKTYFFNDLKWNLTKRW